MTASATPVPVIVVGSGRCGSTLVSSFLNSHPDVLSLSEFFTMMMDLGGRIPETFGTQILSGEAFWQRISAPMPRANLLIREELQPSEFLYPNRLSGMRFTAATGVPNLSIITLSHLSDDPDALFDALAQTVPEQPDGSPREHYDLLFAWLMARFGARVWVERSSGSLLNMLRLIKLYPDARFVHVLRDSRDVALSMQKHTGFRMYRIGRELTSALGYDPFETASDEGAGNLPEDLAAFLPGRFDRDAFIAAEPPLEDLGRDWSEMVTAGAKLLSGLPPGRLLTIGYEQLCAAPCKTMARLAEFIGVPANDVWLAETAARIRPCTSRWENLPEAQKARLDSACAPGLALVAAHAANS